MLSADSLDHVAPVEPARMPGRTVVPWDKDDLDTLGFFKVDVLALGMLLLEARAGAAPSWLPEATMQAALAPWPQGSHVLGFDTKSGAAPSAGARFGSRTFGHLGFTGTSLWIDPDAGFVGVLLTNRVHPSREHVAIRSARPLVYDAIADALDAALAGDG